MQRLHALGLVGGGAKGNPRIYPDQVFYRATAKGCAAAGLTPQQTRECLGTVAKP
jgi:hypothetical protein